MKTRQIDLFASILPPTTPLGNYQLQKKSVNLTKSERITPMSTDTQNKSITLYFRDGGSDKVYQASVGPKGAGFVVNFAFGRRGSTLQTGTKTAVPVDYQAAV